MYPIQPWVTVLIVVFSVLFLLLLILSIAFYNKITPPVFPYDEVTTEKTYEIPTQNTTLGSSSDGVVYDQLSGTFYRTQDTCQVPGNRQIWVPEYTPTGGCFCLPPFWGAKCDRQAYNENFFAVGQPETVPAPVLIQTKTPYLSFGDKDSCTNKCIESSSCSAVSWSDNVCTLYSGPITFKETIPFDQFKDSTLYIKGKCNPAIGQNAGCPVFTDRVIVYRGALPLRYWLYSRYAEDSGQMVNLPLKTVWAIDFRPDKTINTGHRGYWSNKPFIFGQKTPYVQEPGDPLNLPPTWIGQTLWVAYE